MGGGCGGGREKDEVLSTIGTGNIVKDGLWDELCRSGSLMSCLDTVGLCHCSLACIDCLVGVGRRGQGEGGSLPIGIGYFCVLVVYMSGSL